jgi:predicted metal-binding protein
MTDIEEDLSELCLKAKNYGAARVSVLPASEVIVDPRVRLKCSVPACPNFGVNLMCPPRVMDPEEFSKALSMYTHTILIQYPLCDDPEKMQAYIKEGSIEVLRSGSDYPQMIKKSQVEFMDLICKLERDAVNMGYRFSAGLTGGPCRLCDRCVGQRVGGPCRHPLRARPSMEALGIDVFKTAENAGMPLTAEGDQEAFWTGLLLVE